MERKHSTPAAVLTVDAITSLLYMFQWSIQANKIIINMLAKKQPFTWYPTAKHPRHNKLAVEDIREKPVDFFSWHRTGVDFYSRNSFANLGSLAIVSVPIQSIIPWQDSTVYVCLVYFIKYSTTLLMHSNQKNMDMGNGAAAR